FSYSYKEYHLYKKNVNCPPLEALKKLIYSSPHRMRDKTRPCFFSSHSCTHAVLRPLSDNISLQDYIIYDSQYRIKLIRYFNIEMNGEERMTQDLATVSNFNLEQYLGTWYEIARLPMKHQPEDSTDISAVYSLNESGKVRVQNRCLDDDGKLDEAIAEASIVDAEHAKLEVSFLPEGLRWI